MTIAEDIFSPERHYDFKYILDKVLNVCDDCGQQMTKDQIIRHGATKLCAQCIRKAMKKDGNETLS